MTLFHFIVERLFFVSAGASLALGFKLILWKQTTRSIEAFFASRRAEDEDRLKSLKNMMMRHTN